MPTLEPNETPQSAANGDAPGDNTGAAWLCVRDAAAALGVSEKTVWRRARAGELIARKVTGARGALVWKIALESTGQSNRTTGQKQADNRTETPESERKQTGQTMRPTGQQAAKPTGQNDRIGATASGSIGNGDTPSSSTDARFMAHLEAENKFLRAALEQRDRDAAELRAALRAALKLTAGETAPQLTAKPETSPLVTGDATPQTKRAASNGALTTQARDATAQDVGAALTYGDIADALERDLEARGL